MTETQDEIKDPNTSAESIKNDQLLNSPKDFIYAQDPLKELSISTSAIIHKKYECKDYARYCCTSETCHSHTYNIFLRIKSGIKYLLKINSKIDSCFCVCGLINEPAKFNNFSIQSYEQFSSNNGKFYAEIDKDGRCCCTCRSILMDVNLIIENRLAGIIKIRGCDDCCLCTCCQCIGIDCSCFDCDNCCNCDNCCKSDNCCKCDNCCICGISCCGDSCNCCDCDNCCICGNCCYRKLYTCEILDSNKELRYFILFYICNCTFLCCKCVRKCCGLKFIITDRSMENEVGSIEEIDMILGEFFNDSDTYNVIFPMDASPELKLTIINAVSVIDTFLLF